MSERKTVPFPTDGLRAVFRNARPSSGSRIFPFDKVQHLLCEFEQAVQSLPSNRDSLPPDDRAWSPSFSVNPRPLWPLSEETWGASCGITPAPARNPAPPSPSQALPYSPEWLSGNSPIPLGQPPGHRRASLRGQRIPLPPLQKRTPPSRSRPLRTAGKGPTWRPACRDNG